MENNHDLLQVLTREGVLLSVSVRYWRGCKKLNAEDLGLDSRKVSDRLISLGHKRLLPKEATAQLGLIAGRAHALVEGNTFPFLNGLAHFVPNSKLADVSGKLKEMEKEFWTAKETFIHKYAELRESAAKEWQTMAKKLVSDPERLVASIEAAFPPVGKMDRFFGFDIQLFQIAVPDRLGLDRLALGDQEQNKLVRMNEFIFGSLGFTGNMENYYDPENSYLNRVVDRRTGNPINLCLVYLMLARRLRLPIAGIGLPGHFICRFQSTS